MFNSTQQSLCDKTLLIPNITLGTQARIYLYLCSLQFQPLPGSLILQGRTTVLPVAMRYVWPGVTKVGSLSSLMISRSFEPGYASAPEIKARDQVTGDIRGHVPK